MTCAVMAPCVEFITTAVCFGIGNDRNRMTIRKILEIISSGFSRSRTTLFIGIFVSTVPQNQARRIYKNLIDIRSAFVKYDN